MTRKIRYVRTLFALLAWALYLPEAKAYLPEAKTPLPEAKAAASTTERPMADKVSCALNAAEAFEGNDSAYHLSEAVVNAKLKHREIMVPQTLSGEALKRMSNLNVADALRYFSGLQLKDYGGIGGIKTVNIRSMGTHHLGIAYDGIALGNAQNGQIDLGQFSLDNVEEISLYNGQRSAALQTASDFSNAGTVYIRTRQPQFSANKPWHLKLKAQGGSSDTWRLNALWEQRLSPLLSHSLSVGGLISSGRYKFRYRKKTPSGAVAYDTTAVRHNGDIRAVRAEENLYGRLTAGLWQMKAYTYHSERGIPGAIVSNVWRRGERQWDHNSFLQGNLRKDFGERFSSRLTAKYAYYQTRYVNNDETQIHVDNTYRQQELFASWANAYEILPQWWTLSLSYDFRWNRLDANLTDFARPRRLTHALALASSVNAGGLKAQASVVAQDINDRVEIGTAGHLRPSLSPAIVLSYVSFPDAWLTLRAFCKRSFRMPTFNDLYYADMGSSALKPERALQYDAGVTFETPKSRLPKRCHWRLQTDAYYNSVGDKIVAYPKGQQFRWTMLNLGRVHIKGIEALGELTLMPSRNCSFTARLQYTYQDARDVTNPNNSFHRHQIPYIPWHSGTAVLAATWKAWSLNYSFIYTGERYSQQENIRVNHLEPWYTHDLSLSYQAQRWQARLDVNNLLAQDYDVIVNYPMPKRHFMLTLEYDL